MLEAEQEKLFEIKSRFMREIPHPKLILKALRETGIKKENINSRTENKFAYSKLTLCEMLTMYLDDFYALKLWISKAKNFPELASGLTSLLECHTNFIKKLAEYVAIEMVDTKHELKVSLAFDAYQMIKYIELNGLQESQIKPYICEQVKLIPLKELDVLSTSCLRAKKIIENG